jgi:hypothetical protein
MRSNSIPGRCVQPGKGLVSTGVEEAHDNGSLAHAGGDGAEGAKLLGFTGRVRVVAEDDLGAQEADALGGSRDVLVHRSNVDVDLDSQMVETRDHAILLLDALAHPGFSPRPRRDEFRGNRGQPHGRGSRRRVHDHGVVALDGAYDLRTHQHQRDVAGASQDRGMRGVSGCVICFGRCG